MERGRESDRKINFSMHNTVISEAHKRLSENVEMKTTRHTLYQRMPSVSFLGSVHYDSDKY